MIADEPSLVAAIHRLLEKKRAALETGLDDRVPEINAFIEAELARLESSPPPKVEREPPLPLLNQIFKNALE
jgi:uncharacterized protein